MTKQRLKIGQPYHVTWDDAMVRTNWADNDTKDFLDDPPDTEFMGWYDGTNKKALVFIMHRDVPPGKVVGERIKVPKGMVKTVKHLCYTCTQNKRP